MKVAVLNNASPFLRGGAEHLADSLVEQLRLHGHQAELYRTLLRFDTPQQVQESMLSARLWRLTRSLAAASGAMAGAGAGRTFAACAFGFGLDCFGMAAGGGVALPGALCKCAVMRDSVGVARKGKTRLPFAHSIVSQCRKSEASRIASQRLEAGRERVTGDPARSGMATVYMHCRGRR